MRPTRRLFARAALLAAAVPVAGCAPIIVGGIAVGAMAAVDRRTLGAQTGDTEIELRGASRVADGVKGGRGVTVTSYNGRVLLTGQVPEAAAKADAEQLMRRVPGVREVHNELEIAERAGVSATASDAALTARLKAALLEQKGLDLNAVKIVTESGVVYLMGLVTQREGPGYASVASRVSGVRRVVTLFEYITEDELARLRAPR